MVTLFNFQVDISGSEIKLVHPSNAEEAIEVNPVKYCNSLNFRIVVLFLKTDPNEVTAAAIEEGRRIASDSSVKGYTNIEDLKAALEV